MKQGETIKYRDPNGRANADESHAYAIDIDPENNDIITLETGNPWEGRLEGIRNEHKLIFNHTYAMGIWEEYHGRDGMPNNKERLRIDWAGRPKPFQKMSGIDITLGLIAESIFGTPPGDGYGIIRINKPFDDECYGKQISEEHMDDCFLRIARIREDILMIRHEARITATYELMKTAKEAKPYSQERNEALEIIAYLRDPEYRSPDIWITIDLTKDMIPELTRDHIYNLLDSLDEN